MITIHFHHLFFPFQLIHIDPFQEQIGRRKTLKNHPRIVQIAHCYVFRSIPLSAVGESTKIFHMLVLLLSKLHSRAPLSPYIVVHRRLSDCNAQSVKFYTAIRSFACPSLYYDNINYIYPLLLLLLLPLL